MLGKNVIVTAHPDDETLWCGGLPLAYPGDWTIICCSIPIRDPIRAWKFFDACDALGAKGRLLPVEESVANQSISQRLGYMNLDAYDRIITHNAVGEYGHVHHQDVHRYIIKNYARKEIYTIGFGNGEKADIELNLTPVQAAAKLAALKKYNHCLLYGGKNMPKWQALLQRYEAIGYNIGYERYHAHKA